jgi:hypothetical protein
MKGSDGVERVLKEAIVAKFNVLYRHLPGEIDENHENISYDSWSLDRDSNSRPGEYEAAVLVPLLERVHTRL